MRIADFMEQRPAPAVSVVLRGNSQLLVQPLLRPQRDELGLHHQRPGAGLYGDRMEGGPQPAPGRSASAAVRWFNPLREPEHQHLDLAGAGDAQGERGDRRLLTRKIIEAHQTPWTLPRWITRRFRPRSWTNTAVWGMSFAAEYSPPARWPRCGARANAC